MHKAKWDDTLLDYLNASDEDGKVVDFFASKVYKIYDYLNVDNLDWIDVGTGPGGKAIRILQMMQAESLFREVVLDVLEPSLFWRNKIQRFEREGLIRQVVDETFQEFGAPRLTAYGLISLVHVLHDLGDTDELVRILNKIRVCGSKHVVVVVVESESSDLFQIRLKLAEAGLISSWGAPVRRLATLLEKGGYDHDVVDIEPEACRLSGDVVMDAWLYPFLLATSTVGYRAMAREQREHVEMVVSEYLQTRPTGVLQVPDVGFTIYLP